MTEASLAFNFPDQHLSNPSHLLNALFGTAVALNMAVAVWRLPQTQELHLAISLGATVTAELPVLESARPGFLFCPFAVTGTQPAHYLSADILYNATRQQLIIDPVVAGDIACADRLRIFRQEVKERLAAAAPASWHIGSSKELVSVSKSYFTGIVEEGIRRIRDKEMEKVVLSRARTLPLPEGFNVMTVYLKLTRAYPLAFVYLVSVPGSGTWMGASPETLVHLDRHHIFRTEALAGTQPYQPGTVASEAIWRQKEIEEQSLVVRYIINCFKKIRLREYVETGPRTVIAGNLMHLKTDFNVDLKEVDFPALATQMMHLLHPTSAVCGMPREPARQFILDREGYQRDYYSGFMGPVRLHNETRLFVTLRCTQLTSSRLVLYAGAGVTGESIPEKEWLETEIKMETMLSVIQNHA